MTKDHACFGPSLDYVSYACKLMLSDAGSVVCNHNQGEKRRAYASEVPNPAGFRPSCCIGFVCIGLFCDT